MDYGRHKTWSLEQLKENMIPDDFHHLWNILCKNKEKITKFSSIICDLKMIRGLYPMEIKNISYRAYDLLNDSNTGYDQDSEYDLYLHLAYCYLKYGLDGIQIKKQLHCSVCNKTVDYIENEYDNNKSYEEAKEKMMEVPCYLKSINHEIQFHSLSGYCILYCIKCGVNAKRSINSGEDLENMGVCTTIQQHTLINKRILCCPYEKWSWWCDDEN